VVTKRTIQRFRKRSIALHWVHSAAFVTLVITGLLLYVPAFGVVAAGGATRLLHRIAAVLFGIAPLCYAITNPSSAWHFLRESFTWGSRDLGWVRAAPGYYFGGDETKMPPQPHINTGQKLWQLIVILSSVVFLITGALIWFFGPNLPAGVISWCVVVHDIAFIIVLIMFLVHVYLGSVHPRMTESFRSMLDGKVSAEYARSHYQRWYEEITGNQK
jgi:formate dehydrogenase subunit gamma